MAEIEHAVHSIMLKSVDEDGNTKRIGPATIYVGTLAPDEFAIRDYSDGQGNLESLIKAKILESPHRYVQTGTDKIPICRTTTKYSDKHND